MRSKIRWPFQKWQMAYVSRPVETVDNEASRYIYIFMEHTKLKPRNWLISTSENAICKDS